MENNVDFRRHLKRQSPSVFVREEHTQNCRLIPDRLRLLELLPSGGIAAEVGAASGDFTREIIKRNNPSKLHLVDMWSSERYKAGLDAIVEEHKERIESQALVINQGMSTERLPEFSNSYFDWVYIDTDHSYETTIKELRIAAEKTKPEGFITGHDFCVGNVLTPWPYGVVEACNQFCVEDGWQYRFLTIEPHGHQSFALSRL